MKQALKMPMLEDSGRILSFLNETKQKIWSFQNSSISTSVFCLNEKTYFHPCFYDLSLSTLSPWKKPAFLCSVLFPVFWTPLPIFFRRKLMAAEWLTDWLLWLFLPIRKKLSHSKYKIELNHQIVYCNYFLPKVNLSTFHDNEIVSLSFPISVSKDVSIIEGCSGKKLLQVRPENLMESYTNTNNQLIRAFVAKFENKKRFVFN